MADLAREFISNSNEAVHVKIKQPADPSKDVEFHPKFTYSIFNNEEVIFGYRNLHIDLNFAADTLKAGLGLEYSDKIERVGDTEADVIENKLQDFLPTIGLRKDAPKPEVIQNPEPFVPPGELIHQYTVNGRSFGVWEVNLTDPRAKQILRHMQIFVHFFIEGGTFIDLDDPDWTIERWTIYFLYAIDAHPKEKGEIYSFAGYGTAYRLFHLDLAQNSYLLTPPSSQGSSPNAESAQLPEAVSRLQSQLPSRQRISQFIILPPYQRSSHGSHLYTSMLVRATADPTVAELTVEDPNEDFDDLRDTNDLLRLRATSPAFLKLKINADVKLEGNSQERAHAPLPKSQLLDADTIEQIRKESRLCDRQLGRLIEVQCLSNIPPLHRSMQRITRKDKASDANDRAYYWWRLLVKQRLTKHNKDTLQQLEIEERVERLEDTLDSVLEGYKKILERCDARTAVVLESEKKHTNGESKRGKRRVVDDDDEPVTNGTPRKRAKVVSSDDE